MRLHKIFDTEYSRVERNINKMFSVQFRLNFLKDLVDVYLFKNKTYFLFFLVLYRMGDTLGNCDEPLENSLKHKEAVTPSGRHFNGESQRMCWGKGGDLN